jgi:hypothetical protein
VLPGPSVWMRDDQRQPGRRWFWSRGRQRWPLWRPQPVEGGHWSSICREWVRLYRVMVGLPPGSTDTNCARLVSGQSCWQRCSCPHMERKARTPPSGALGQTGAGWGSVGLLYPWQLWINNLWLGEEVYNQKGGEQAWICGSSFFWLRGWYRKMRERFTRFP